MRGPDGAGQAVVGGDRDAPARGRAQRGVGRDHRDRGVQRVQRGRQLRECVDLLGRRRRQRELFDQVRHPRQAGGPVDDVARGVHHDDRADGDAGAAGASGSSTPCRRRP